MVDGAIVLVDAAEGPMPQTKFVVGKALKIGLKPIVARQQGRQARTRAPSEVVNEVFDLFAALDATDEQLDFPILYGSAKQGWMAAVARRPEGPGHGAAVRPRAEARAAGRRSRRARSACSARCSRPTRILGRIVTGRISAGTRQAEPADQGPRPRRHGSSRQGRVSKILAFRGIERQPIEIGEAGDIVAIAGLEKGTVADTFCAPEVDDADPGAADRPADRRP